MTAPTYFTVTGDYRAVVADLLSGTDHDPQLRAITATVTFSPVLASGDMILATTASPRPTGLVPSPVVARIDSDGRLKLRRFATVSPAATLSAFPATGNTSTIYYAIATKAYYRWSGSQYVQTFDFAPVRLLANTALLGLDGPLYYRVEFSNVKINGADESLYSFTFGAPTTDTEVNLVTVGRVPGQAAIGLVDIYAPAGQAATVAARGSSVNVNFNFTSKGSGTVQANGVDVVTTTGSQSISGKTAISSTGVVTGSRLVSTVATGTAPLTVASNTNIPNLNASLLSNLTVNGGVLASSIPARDSNANLLARGFIAGFTTTATAAGTTTLTIASNPIQEFTGTATQTVRLPTTGIVAGQVFSIINNSSATVAVQSSAAAPILGIAAGTEAKFTALVATPTTAAHWEDTYAVDPVAVQTITNKTLTTPTLTTPVINGQSTGTGVAATSSGLTLALRDGNAHLFAKSLVPTFVSTVASATAVTLSTGSASLLEFTGTSTQTVVLPTTGVTAGYNFTIINNSAGALTVKSSALAAVGAALTTGQSAQFFALVATPTTAAHWHRR